MEFQINWKPEEQGDYRRNKELHKILADILNEFCPLEDGCRILDIGGGNGVFAEVLSNQGHAVTVLDCDEEKLSQLPSSIATIHTDWNEIEESDPALTEKHYAIVSNFNTAVQTVDQLRKMNHSAEEWIMINRLLMYKEPLMDRIAKKMDLEVKPVFPNLKRDYIQFNSNSVIAGHQPDVHFNDFTWEDKRTPGEAVDRFLSIYYAKKEIPEGMKEKALEVANAMAVDGILSDPVTAHVAHLHWNVNYR